MKNMMYMLDLLRDGKQDYQHSRFTCSVVDVDNADNRVGKKIWCSSSNNQRMVKGSGCTMVNLA